MPAFVPLAGECRRCETAGRLRRRGRRRNCDRRGRNSRCGGRRCTPARVMRRRGGGRSEARGCRSRGVPAASRQRAAQRGQYRFRIRAGNGYMLIACDAFKIGDGIRIIGRRIALCYITLHYIEKRRIQTAQIPVDRGIVTFNEKITVHATADDVAVIRRARHCHPDQLAARALAFPTTFDIHPIHVTRRICPRGRLKPRYTKSRFARQPASGSLYLGPAGGLSSKARLGWFTPPPRYRRARISSPT